MRFEKKDSMTIKGVAILLLLFYHLFAQTFVYEDFEVEFLLGTKGAVFLSSFGNICVAIFLFISAYGITTSLFQSEKVILDNKQIAKASFTRALILIFHFFIMYVSIWLIWFSKLHYTWVYGEGKQSILFALTDALGLAEIFQTPTICMTWWYMELAILCIFIVPFFQMIYKKINMVLLAGLLVIPCVISVDMDVYKYIFVVGIGVCAANGNWINRLKEIKLHFVLKVGIASLFMMVTFLVRSNAIVSEYYAFFAEGIIAFVWVVGIYIIFEKIPIITKILQFFGKYSMNIFFTHTFFYMIMYRDVLYSLKYAGLIYMVLLGISLLYSIVIEFIKRRIGFYILVKKIKEGING